jgi:heat shock protein HslJ
LRIGTIAPLAALLALVACSGAETYDAAPKAAAAQPAADPMWPLKGTRWRGIINPAFDPSHTPWLEFVNDERITGYTGCNMLSGGWRMDNGRAMLGPMITTKRACAGPEEEIERRFLAVLGPKSSLSREGSKLVITNPDDGRRFEFYKAD